MSANHRYLKGSINPIIAPVNGNIVIYAGDLVCRNGYRGMMGSGVTADFTTYPFNLINTVGASVVAQASHMAQNFLGVAMESSPSGVTENITIATSGVFRYPVHDTIVGGAVTVGALISAVSNSSITAGAGPSAQHVIHGTAGGNMSTCYLGYIIKTESGASFVDFQLRTTFGAGGLAS